MSRRLPDAVAVLAIAVVSSALILAPPLDRFRGLSIDILTWLRWRANVGTCWARRSIAIFRFCRRRANVFRRPERQYPLLERLQRPRRRGSRGERI
jgi:hypothetical protein